MNKNNNNQPSLANQRIPDPDYPGRTITRRTLRNRRARQRRNRNRTIIRQRLGGGQQLQQNGTFGFSNTGQPLRLSAAAESKEAEEENNLFDLLSPQLAAYADAVIHPFGPGSIGATMPDSWTTTSLPVTDRITLDIDPSLFFNANTPLVTLEGIAVALLPRCLAAGWARSLQGNNMFVPGISSNADLSVIADTTSEGTERWTPANQYYLLISAIGTTAGQTTVNQFAYYSIDSTMRTSGQARWNSGIQRMGAYNAVQFTRFNPYNDNCDGGRIIGAGVKVWSEAAPINTGGTCYGGWVAVEDLFDCYSGSNKSPGNMQDILFMRRHFRGVDGCTVRYDNTQSPEQAEYVVPVMNNVSGTIQAAFDGPPDIAIGTDWSSQDEINPGDYVPMIVWKYDSSDQASTYSLRVEARVHVQGKPKGTSPFASVRPYHDPLLVDLVNIISNPMLFPIVVEGHSFKSFWKKIKEIAGKGAKVLGQGAVHVQRFLDVANKYVPQGISMVEKYSPLIAEAAAMM